MSPRLAARWQRWAVYVDTNKTMMQRYVMMLCRMSSPLQASGSVLQETLPAARRGPRLDGAVLTDVDHGVDLAGVDQEVDRRC